MYMYVIHVWQNRPLRLLDVVEVIGTMRYRRSNLCSSPNICLSQSYAHCPNAGDLLHIKMCLPDDVGQYGKMGGKLWSADVLAKRGHLHCRMVMVKVIAIAIGCITDGLFHGDDRIEEKLVKPCGELSGEKGTHFEVHLTMVVLRGLKAVTFYTIINVGWSTAVAG